MKTLHTVNLKKVVFLQQHVKDKTSVGETKTSRDGLRRTYTFKTGIRKELCNIGSQREYNSCLNVS